MTPFKPHLFDMYVGHTKKNTFTTSAFRDIKFIVMPLITQCKYQSTNMHIRPFNYWEHFQVPGTSCSFGKDFSLYFAWSDNFATIFFKWFYVLINGYDGIDQITERNNSSSLLLHSFMKHIIIGYQIQHSYQPDFTRTQTMSK